MIDIKVTQAELKMIKESREQNLASLVRAEQRRNCKHKFVPSGYGGGWTHWKCACGEAFWED